VSEKLLKTCKRLNKFTLEEFQVVTEFEESVAKLFLSQAVCKKQLILRDGTYFYLQEKSPQRTLLKLPLLFQYHSAETVDMIIRAFSAEIPSTKTGLLLGLNCNIICKFNKFFRKILYERQYQKLLEHYKQHSQIPCVRIFCETPACFYTYGGRVFVAAKPIDSNAQSYTDKKSMSEFKKVYSFITRDKELHKFANHLEHRIAETIWRRNKPFEQLLDELKALLNA